MLKNKVCIILPCYKVKNKIYTVYKKLNQKKLDCLIFVDDNCPEKSVDFLQSKIKKNKLSSNLNTLNLEKRKLERISEDLKEMLEQSSFVEGEILNSSQLRQMSSFRENLQEKLQISSNREIHLEKEMNNYLSEISKIKKQKEKIEKKIKEEALLIEKMNELRKDHNFKTKVMI